MSLYLRDGAGAMEIVFNTANIITIVRMALTPVFAILFALGSVNYAFWVYVVISWSDALDGIIARHWNQKTEFGAFMDPLADKFLLTVGFLILTYFGHIPLWLCAIVIARDVVILITVRVFWTLKRVVEFKPVMSGKMATAFQLLVVAYALYNGSVGSIEVGYFPSAPHWLYMYIIYITGFFTALSWFQYMTREYRVQYGNKEKA